MQINIVAMAGMVAYYSGVIRIVPDNADRARSVLECMNLRFDEYEALAVDLSDTNRELTSVLHELQGRLVNATWIYPTLAGTSSF